MANTSSSFSINLGWPGLLGLLFIGLKLTNYIDWSWLWVLAPFWIPLSLWLVIVVPVVIFGVFVRSRPRRGW